MDAKQVGGIVSGGIPLILGCCFVLVGHRRIGKPPGESAQYDAWHAKHGGRIRLVAPLIAVFGLIRIILAFV